MIRIENLSKTYGLKDTEVKALKNVSLEIEEGEMLAIVGVSGSGKSTLLQILGGLDTDAEGKVFYNDLNIMELDDEKLSNFRLNNIGFVYQFFELIPELTAEENIMLPLMMSKRKLQIPQEIISKLGIGDRLKHYPHELSGGQKQRCAIARAIINDPQIILADEPTGALDSKTAAEIIELFKSLSSEGKTVVIVTHDKKAAGECSRVIEISDGRIF